MTLVGCFILGFEDGGRDREPRNAALEAGEGKETDSSLESPERMWPCQHLAFTPVKVTLGFQPPEL